MDWWIEVLASNFQISKAPVSVLWITKHIVHMIWWPLGVSAVCIFFCSSQKSYWGTVKSWPMFSAICIRKPWPMGPPSPSPEPRTLGAGTCKRTGMGRDPRRNKAESCVQSQPRLIACSTEEELGKQDSRDSFQVPGLGVLIVRLFEDGIQIQLTDSPSNKQNAFQTLEIYCGPRSETMSVGNLCNLKTWFNLDLADQENVVLFLPTSVAIRLMPL